MAGVVAKERRKGLRAQDGAGLGRGRWRSRQPRLPAEGNSPRAPPPLTGLPAGVASSHDVLGAGLGKAGGQSCGQECKNIFGCPVHPSTCAAAWGRLSAPGLPLLPVSPPSPPTCRGRGRHPRSRFVCVCMCVFRVFLKRLCSCALLGYILQWVLGTWRIVGLFWAWHYWELYSVSVRKQHQHRLSWGVLDAS